MAGSARSQGHGRPSRSSDFVAFIQPAAASGALPGKARQLPKIRQAAGRRPSPRCALANAHHGGVRTRQPHDERAHIGPCPLGLQDVQTSQPPCQGRSLQKFETGHKSPIPGCRFDLNDTSGPVNRACRLISPGADAPFLARQISPPVRSSAALRPQAVTRPRRAALFGHRQQGIGPSRP